MPLSPLSLLQHSHGMPGWQFLSSELQAWLGPLADQLPSPFTIHDDTAAHEVARRSKAAGLCIDDRIVLGGVPLHLRDAVLRHELVHLAQVNLARRGTPIAVASALEAEAEAIAALPVARPARYGASPDEAHPLVWFLALGVGGFVALRPSPANAPGPGDATLPRVTEAQVLGEALAIFAVPGGALALGGRFGLGFLGSTALAGASGNTSLRAVSDLARGQSSPAYLYLFDAATGAVLGYVVPGAVRFIGQRGTVSLDKLAMLGMTRSDMAITRALHDAAQRAPLTAAAAQPILQRSGLAGGVSRWWLERRGVIVLYRGQDKVHIDLLSPLARQDGVAASQALVARMRGHDLSSQDIATYAARWHSEPIPAPFAPPGMALEPLGATGIPTTRLPGVAASFAGSGADGTVYILRMPTGAAIKPVPWHNKVLEDEWIILDRIPPGSVVKTMPARQLGPLMVDPDGRLIPGYVGR